MVLNMRMALLLFLPLLWFQPALAQLTPPPASVPLATSLPSIATTTPYCGTGAAGTAAGCGAISTTGAVTITGTAATDGPTYGTTYLTGGALTCNGWTSCSISSGTLTATAPGNTNALSYSVNAINAQPYQITATTTGSAGTVTIAIGGVSETLNYGQSAIGWGPTTTSTAALTVTPTAAFNGTLTLTIVPISGSASPIIQLNTSNSSDTVELRTGLPGLNNTFFGLSSGTYNTTGSYNSALGQNALHSNTTGSYNNAIGQNALHSNTTGSKNTAEGFNAGNYLSDGSTGNSTPNNSLYLGTNTEALSPGNNTNENVVGYSAVGNGSNTTTVGNSSITATYLAGLTYANGYQSNGTTFTASGCSNSSLAGGSTAGKFKSGTSGTCTVTITMGASLTAANGWSCHANDETNANTIRETGYSTTTATLSGTTTSSDVIDFACVGF